MGQFIAISDKR